KSARSSSRAFQESHLSPPVKAGGARPPLQWTSLAGSIDLEEDMRLPTRKPATKSCRSKCENCKDRRQRILNTSRLRPAGAVRSKAWHAPDRWSFEQRTWTALDERSADRRWRGMPR